MADPRDPAARNNAKPNLRISQILTYSSPLLAVNFITSLTTTYFVKYGTDVLLVAPAAMSLLYGCSRLWEAINDPLVGFLSDRTRHRLGRRRSWLAGAALPLVVLPFAMWAPPSFLEGWSLIAWLAIACFALASAVSAFMIPHTALGAELSPESQHRTRLFASNGIAAALASFAALTLGLGALRRAESPRDTALVLFAALGLLMLSLVIPMVARSREPAEHQGRGSDSPLRAYRDVLRNAHARIIVLANLFINITYGAMGTVAVYMLQYVMRIPESTELFMVAYFIPTLLAMPLWVRLSDRYEKRHLWMMCLAASSVLYGALGLVPENPGLPVVLGLGAAAGLFGGGFFVFEAAIRAEVIDYDEYVTGERKEGVYSAASQLVGKGAAAGMTMLVGMALGGAGYTPNVEQTESVKWVIRLLFGGVPAVAFFITLVMLTRFKLTRRLHDEVRKELAARSLT